MISCPNHKRNNISRDQRGDIEHLYDEHQHNK